MRKTVYIVYVFLFLILIVLLIVGLISYSNRDDKSAWNPDNVQEDTTTEEDVLSEEDYIKMAEAYEEQGNSAAQRETLIELHKHYPSEDYVKQISGIVVQKDSSDTMVAGLMDNLINYLLEDDADGLRKLVDSDEWKQQLQDTLVGVQRKTEFTGEQTIQVVSDAYTTTAAAQLDTDTYLYFTVDAGGMITAEVGYADGSYQDECRISYFNENDMLIRDFTGTFMDNVCVEDFSITYEEIIYSGTLQEDGTTAEEQIEEVTEDGNVIYAYAEDGSFLYEPDEDVETFVIDREYLGLPQTLVW